MTNKINTSSYSIQKKWIEEVAPRYFNINDTSMLKAGLFGYINDVLSNACEDSLHMHSILSKEIFPNKAVLPDSIYAYSALANFDDFYATAAVIPIVIALRKNDVLKYAEINNVGKYKELILSKFSKINIENSIPFILDYNIRIICRPIFKDNKNDYIISAQYDMSEPNPVSDIKSPFISSIVLEEDNTEYIFLRVNARQLERSQNSQLIYSNDIVETINFETDFEGKLAGFNVYYKESSFDTDQILLDKYFINSSLPDNLGNFCFYNLSNTNKINISFSAHPSYFKPKFNSELIIEVFTTLGTEGNFIYNGTNTGFVAVHPDENKDISNILGFVQVLGNSSGGKDQPELSEIKKKVIEEFSTRKNLITDLDLKRYFDSKSENCNILFTKKRDDLIQRIYSAFLLLRNEKNEIIPTNTIDCLIYEDEFSNYEKGSSIQTLKAGTIFEAQEGISLFRKANDNYVWADLIKNDSLDNNYIYGCPFLIKINSNPLFLSYYLNSIYDDFILTYSYLNDNSYEEFITNNLNITRNAIKSNSYDVSIDINTTLNLESIFEYEKINGECIINGFTEKDPYGLDIENIKIIGFIEENDNITGYFKLDPIKFVDNKLHCLGSLTTNDYINTDDKLLLTECVYSTTLQTRESLKNTFPIGNTNTKFSIAIYYDGYDDDKNKYIYEKLVPDMENYTLCNVYKTEENIELFKNLNNIMQSSVLLKVSENKDHPGVYYKIKKIPMIRYLYMEDDNNMKEIIKILSHFKTELTDSLPLLENNFNLDTKFYNTYGESQFFTIGRNKQNLNMVSISLKLNIKLITEITTDLITEIKSYIANFIEGTNDLETNFLYISNLLRNIEEQFPEISYVEFLGFNDYDSSYQIIENNFTDLSDFTKEQVINYVPEYLNINRHVILDNGTLSFEPRITINFV